MKLFNKILTLAASAALLAAFNLEAYAQPNTSLPAAVPVTPNAHPPAAPAPSKNAEASTYSWLVCYFGDNHNWHKIWAWGLKDDNGYAKIHGDWSYSSDGTAFWRFVDVYHANGEPTLDRESIRLCNDCANAARYYNIDKKLRLTAYFGSVYYLGKYRNYPILLGHNILYGQY